MAVDVKMLGDLVPLARAMTVDTFCQRFPHPFLLGKEVLEEEFNFRTQVAPRDAVSAPGTGTTSTDNVVQGLRIRDWVVAVTKPSEPAATAPRVFVGRASNNDIVIPHPTVSKLHAYLVRDHDRWWLSDVGSSNGTKVNGLPAPVRARVSVNDGDTILFGRCSFNFILARRLFELLKTMSTHSGRG